MPTEGFKNQWVAISKIGKFKDNTNTERDLSEDFLKQVIANFTPKNAPAVIGHPEDNGPAWGWASALRLNNGVLEAQFADTDDAFEQMVVDGKFRKRSASFYIDKPNLRHVGFLGAMPPAIKGLPDIQFSDGESVTVEISFSEEQKIMKDEEVEKVTESLFDKIKNLLKTEKSTDAPSASFTEADAQKLISDAVKTATETITADFTEKLEAKDAIIETLRSDVNKQTSSGKRAEIIAFVEGIPATSGRHFLKRAGVVEFMETLANDDAAVEEKAICFSEGEGDKKVEHKFSRLEWAKELLSNLPPMISFGEKFGNIVATDEADATEGKDPKRVASMKEKMGVQDEGGSK